MLFLYFPVFRSCAKPNFVSGNYISQFWLSWIRFHDTSELHTCDRVCSVSPYYCFYFGDICSTSVSGSMLMIWRSILLRSRELFRLCCTAVFSTSPSSFFCCGAFHDVSWPYLALRRNSRILYYLNLESRSEARLLSAECKQHNTTHYRPCNANVHRVNWGLDSRRSSIPRRMQIDNK